MGVARFAQKIPSSVYDPRRVLVTFGPVPLLGRAPGRSISGRRDVPTWSSVTGTNGEFVRRRSRTKSGTIEVTLRGTAPVNRPLGILAKVDEKHGNIFLLLAVTDTLNGGLLLGTKAYIETYPEMNYSTTEGDITWRFRCEDLDMTFPGVSLETLVRLGSLD